jgi:hypothetical protein
MTQTVARFSSVGDLMLLGEVIEEYPLTSSMTYAPEGTTNVIHLTDLNGLHHYYGGDPSYNAVQQSNSYWRVYRVNPQGHSAQEILMGNTYTVSPGQTWTESFYFMWDGNGIPTGWSFTFFTNNGHHSVAANVQDCGNGLYRAYATYTIEAGATYLRALDFWPPSTAYNWSYMDIYYAQLEQKDHPTPWVNGTRPDNCILLAGQIMEDVNDTWVVANLNKNTGSNVTDPDSSTGTARKYTAGTDSNGVLLSWGPYYKGLTTGNNAVLYWRMKASKNTNTGNVVMIRAHDNTLGDMATKYIKGTDFQQANVYQWFALPFTIPSGTLYGLELYTYPESTDTDIYIDTIRVAQPRSVQPVTNQNISMGKQDLYIPSRLQESAVNSISFVGNSGQYVNIPNSSSLQVINDQTIEIILIPNNIGAYRMNPIYKSYGAEFAITVETGGGLSYYWGTNGADGGNWQGFTSNSVITNNNLWHITIVRDIVNQQLRWYINGNLDRTGVTSYGAAVASTYPVKLMTGYAGGTMGGTLVQARVWNRALTQTDISNYLFSDLIGNENGLVGYWKFRESFGTTCFDSTSNGNNGTINGSATRVFV